MSEQPRLVCREVGKIFSGSGKSKITALENVSFEMGTGQIIGLLGPDGAGKSTLLRLITGLMKPTSGSISVQGLDTVRDKKKIPSHMGYMPQKFGLYEDLTVEENLLLYSRLYNIPVGERQERFKTLLDMSSLDRFTDRPAGKLSGGMKQKLGLICTLISSPGLIILDEPTVGVDPLSRQELWLILRKLAKEEGVSVLASTSYLDESSYCHKTLILYEGRLLKDASPAEVTRLAEGKTFSITPPGSLKPRQIQSLLASYGSTINATITGNKVRLVMPPDSQEFDKIKTWNPEPEEPDFSDGFMSLLVTQKKDEDIVNVDNNLKEQHENSSDTIVEVQDLTRKFGNFVAVDHVSFKVHKGEIFGLLGPNGAGKSTTFRMLCGLLPASEGQLNVAGVNLRVAAPKARRKIGYMAQKFSQYGNLTVRQNLDFTAGAYGMSGTEKNKRINEILNEFNLHNQENVPAGLLPGGYKQRMGMACALLHKPEILFLDEPTSGADPFARRSFWQRISALADAGVTIIVTTHFLDEAEFCDNMIIMMDGKNLAQGSPTEIRSHALAKNGKIPTLEEAFIAITREYVEKRKGGKES